MPPHFACRDLTFPGSFAILYPTFTGRRERSILRLRGSSDVKQTVKLRRSGHNGADSKSLLLRGTPSPEVLIYQGFQHPLSEFSGEFSPKILLFSPDFGSSLLIWSGIEVVITGLTRNRMSFMHPPWPGTLDFTGFSEGSKAKNHICSPHQFSPKSEVFFGGQMLR